MDENMPKKKMRVREIEILYMTTKWMQAIWNKLKYAKIYAKSRIARLSTDMSKTFRLPSPIPMNSVLLCFN